MRIGFLSDAHGSPTALAACLHQLQALGVDALFFLGDAVGYLPGERDVLALLREARVSCQKGNHEAMLLGEIPVPPEKEGMYRLDAARSRLSAAEREWIAAWPQRRVLQIEGRKILLVHGSPDNDLEGYVYPADRLAAFTGLEYRAIFMGHTHYPFVERRGDTLFVNVGSCGLPRDRGDQAAFAVYDARSNQATVFRVHIDTRKILDGLEPHGIHPEVLMSLHRRPPGPVFGVPIGGGG